MTGLDLQVPLIFNVRASASSCACLDLETFAASKTMWTPPPLWTHRTRPQGLEISHRTRDSHSVHIDHSLRKERERRTKTAHTNCPRDRIRSTVELTSTRTD